MTSFAGVGPEDCPQCEDLSLARRPVDRGLPSEIGSRKIQLLLGEVLRMHKLLLALSHLLNVENRFQFLESFFHLFIGFP